MLLQRKNYNLLIIIYIFAFSLIPIITRNILPYDMIENLYWGKELQLGYEKHPPLFAWISFFFYKLCLSCPESLYFLTQLNFLLGLYFIFKTSELIFKDEAKSYASVLILMASVCAVFGNEKFNASTILMSLFPAMFFFFIRIIKFNKKADAFLLGVISALAFLGKYFALGFIGCIGLFLLLNRECWYLFKTPLPYITVITFFICISWHLHWIYESDFVTIKYALDKSAFSEKSFFSAFNFLLMQFIFFATAFLGFAHAYSGEMKFLPAKSLAYTIEENFILFITVIPNLVLFLASLSTGMRIGSFWGTNMLMMLGSYLLIINKEKIHYQKLFVFVKRMSIFFAIILFIKLGIARYFLKIYDPTNAIDIRKTANCIDEDWMNKFGSKRMRVLKTDKATAELHIHLKASPSSYDAKHMDQFRIYNSYPRDENVVISFLCDENGIEIKDFKNYYRKDILFENTVHVINNYVVYYAFVNVASNYEEKRN